MSKKERQVMIPYETFLEIIKAIYASPEAPEDLKKYLCEKLASLNRHDKYSENMEAKKGL